MDLNLFKTKNINKQNILTIGSYTFTASELVGGVSYNHTVNSGTDIVLGSCTAATIEFQLNNMNQLINNLAGQEITWKKRVETSPGIFEDIPMGIFIAEKPTRINDNRIRVKAYDRMIKFDIIVDDWLRTVSYPITLKNFLLGLCSHVGVTLSNTTFLNDNFPLKFNFLGTNVKGREVLKWIAEIAAKYAVINELGQLRLGWYNNIVYSVNNSNYYSIKVEDYQVKKIDKLQVQVEENDIGVIVGTGTNAYVIQNNPLLYAATDAEIRPYVTLIYNAIKDFTYIPFEIKVNDNPLIKAGNSFQVTTRKGQVFNAVVMSRRMTDGNDVYSATGNIDRSINKSVNASIKQLRGKTNVLERTVEHTINRLYDADTGDLTQLTQTANTITSKIMSVEEGMSEITQRADNIELSVTSLSNTVSTNYTTLNGTINDVEVDLNNAITSVSNVVTQNKAAIDLRADSIVSSVSSLSNTVTTNYNALTGDIASIDTEITNQWSEITQRADEIELRFDDMKSLSGTDGTLEGGVTKVSAAGIVVSTTSGNSKLEMLANSGFALWTNTGSGLEKNFYVDSSGKIQAKSLVIAGDSEFKGIINVGTDATIGNILYLGTQTSGNAKGLYFANNSSITSGSGALSINSYNGINIRSGYGNVTIGPTSNSAGEATRIYGGGSGIIISTEYGSGSPSISIRSKGTLNISTDSSYSTYEVRNYGGASFPYHDFRVNGSTIMRIEKDGVDFMNRTPKNLNIDRVSSVQDKNYSTHGIEFRIVSGKLQYKSTASSTWIPLET